MHLSDHSKQLHSDRIIYDLAEPSATIPENGYVDFEGFELFFAFVGFCVTMRSLAVSLTAQSEGRGTLRTRLDPYLANARFSGNCPKTPHL